MSSSSGRTTRNSQKAATLGNTLGSVGSRPPTPSRPTTPPPHPSDFTFLPIPEADEDSSPAEESTPHRDNHSSDHHSDQGSDHNQDVDPEVSLAQSLTLLAKKIDAMPRSKKRSVKPREPDVFDGTDPNKLDNYIFQLTLYLATVSDDFPDDNTRITFALSYLKGTPLDWFQSEMTHALATGHTFPVWSTSIAAFLAELRRLFGPRDAVSDAMNALEALRYKDSTKATRYTIDFNRHGRKTGWNEKALARQYYKGLPDRLKDEIARIGKPDSLTKLQDLVATLDQRYWERQTEISRDKKSPNPSSTSNTTHKSSSSENRSGNQQASGSKPNNHQQSKPKDQKDQKKPYSGKSSSTKKTNTIADLLRADGKLKPEER